MAIDLWLAFVAASIVLLIIPGPTLLAVISYSVAHGRRANVPLVAAVALGDSTALALSLLGLGALLAVSSFWFVVVKTVGGVYLIWLGVNLLRSGVHPGEIVRASLVGSRWRLFANTWLVTALNPKGMIFFVAFLSQFVDTSEPTAPQLRLLSLTFVVLASINATLYGVFAGATRITASTTTFQPCRRFLAGTCGLMGLDSATRVTVRALAGRRWRKPNQRAFAHCSQLTFDGVKGDSR